MTKWAQLFLLFFVLSSNLNAEEDEWGDSWEDDWSEEKNYELSHEISYAFSPITRSDSVNRKDDVLNEVRYRSDFEYRTESFTFNLELELTSDFLINEHEISSRQLNFVKSIGDQTDIKVGRQLITWGTGDLLFLNDLFSKDWHSFFNGRDDRYLKTPIDAFRFSQYYTSINWEVALMPQFRPDNTPNGERYSFFTPEGLQQPSPFILTLVPDKPELATRFFNTTKGIEWSFYGYTGFFKSPSKLLDNDLLTYAEMDAFGASIRLPLADGLLNSEISYYESKEDSKGSDPRIQNSQIRFLIGYEKEVYKNFTMGVQGYLEKQQDYDELVANQVNGQAIPDEHRTLYSLRLTQLAFDQKLQSSLMIFYSPSDEDHYFRLSSRFKINDYWSIVGGLNWLDGDKDETFLSQMQDNSNVFVRVHFGFE